MIELKAVTRDNWEEAMALTYGDDTFVSVSEGLAAAYVKPWDEALDPYVIELDDKIIGFIYVSYTPNSLDDYWIGGFYIHPDYRGKGYGKKSMLAMIHLIQENNEKCQGVRLTVDKNNTRAKSMYESMGFKTEGETNAYDEVRYLLKL